MAQLIVVYWRDIPAQVIVKKGRDAAKVQLDERFEKAIDRAAMRANLRDTDSYLAEWRRAAPVEVGDDLQAIADAKAKELETEFDEAKLKALVEAGGLATQKAS
ncbi:MAG TPA: virulence factor [Candidatus Binatia bacterium]|nr:virulence factor [Candidatus Binatia bacterium]